MTAPPSANADYFRLRAEWLRFKNHVIDSNTELPTLAAVLDDVRRLMEERGTLGLVYLDLGADGQSRDASTGGRPTTSCCAAFAQHAGVAARGRPPRARATSIAVMSVRSDKFLVFLRGPGRRSPRRGLALEGRARRLRERVVRSPARPPAAGRRGPARPSDMGHALMYRDPMLRAERSIHRALDEAMLMTLRQRTRDEDRARPGPGRDHRRAAQVDTLYQPILDLRTRARARATRSSRAAPPADAVRGRGAALRAGRAHGPAARPGAAVPGARPRTRRAVTCRRAPSSS